MVNTENSLKKKQTFSNTASNKILKRGHYHVTKNIGPS